LRVVIIVKDDILHIIGRLRLVKTLSVTDLVDRLGTIASIIIRNNNSSAGDLRILLLRNYTEPFPREIMRCASLLFLRNIGKTKNQKKKVKYIIYYFTTFVLRIIS